MATSKPKYLIINGDDFGSSESANRGIIDAFRNGILRSASLMVPCPWFPQAVELAKEHGLSCGLHMTLTCEYHRYHFGPLTRAPELTRDKKGHTFIANPNELPVLGQDVIYREIEAQMERFLDFGLKPAFVDAHMCVVPRWDNVFMPVADRLYEKFHVPFLRLGATAGPKDLPLAQVCGVGSGGEKDAPLKSRFRAQLEALPDGVSYMNCHPAILTDEMLGMELNPGFAAPRQVDLDVLRDPEVRAWLRELNIEPISALQIPKS